MENIFISCSNNNFAPFAKPITITYKCINMIHFFHIIEKHKDSFIRQPFFYCLNPLIFVVHIRLFHFEDVRDELILQACNAPDF
ncbi:hypothetical protein EUGRSUZ_H03851 [Eucalyptus grandis]|uniref:Uncharacterized protein n=2 Tax=Eucalyptus grandis TaxID=71139 RepID=A0ACC3JUX1_EUCGR|nr:hypothetical protein EUGRSUZ_H03851 [Eucalyptus grandis]